MVALAQLAAEVAHDVNNPLTLILAKAERISRRTRSNQAFDEQIDADAQRVVQTVDRIALTIARLHASARNEIDFEQEYGASNELKVSHSHR
jgi:nitrogen fixation/metabolism regulation signal transduction histidine kinase